MSEEMLPCPFCGAPGMLNTGGDGSGAKDVFCTGDGLTPDRTQMACPLNYHAVTMPIHVWNTRADSTAPLRAQLEEKEREIAVLKLASRIPEDTEDRAQFEHLITLWDNRGKKIDRINGENLALRTALETAKGALEKIGPEQPNDNRWWAVTAREALAKIREVME